MALKIGEPQVLLQSEDDPIPHHHGILICRLRESTWIVVSPEGDLPAENIAEFGMLPLMRAGAIPKAAEVAGCHLIQFDYLDVAHRRHELRIVRDGGGQRYRLEPCDARDPRRR